MTFGAVSTSHVNATAHHATVLTRPVKSTEVFKRVVAMVYVVLSKDALGGPYSPLQSLSQLYTIGVCLTFSLVPGRI